MRVYYVAGPKYVSGPLFCWDRLLELGLVSIEDWHWPDADVGYDGDMVSVFRYLPEAQEFQADYGGRILQITFPDMDPDTDDLGSYPDGYGGYITPRITWTDEGYVAFRDGIPAEWIKVL